MKQVQLTKHFIYNPPGKRGISVHYKTPGKLYEKVPEAHAEAIVEDGAGEIVEEHSNFTIDVDSEEGEDLGSR